MCRNDCHPIRFVIPSERPSPLSTESVQLLTVGWGHKDVYSLLLVTSV